MTLFSFCFSKTCIFLSMPKRTREEQEASDSNDESEQLVELEEVEEEEQFDATPDKAAGLSSTISRLLKSSSTQILPQIQSRINTQKLDEKAKKVLKSETQKEDLAYNPRPDANSSDKILRKIATRGVVVLFNAIRHAQKTEVVKEDEKIEISKSKFKEMIDVQKEASVEWIRDDFVEKEANKVKSWDEEE